MLRGRAIVAIKGLGGYHLACDPFDRGAVRTLRGRKVRQDKPFALMARDLEQVRELCRVGPEEEALLASPARRSEEHTSELQSRQYLVCRLLLQKKNDRHVHANTRGDV